MPGSFMSALLVLLKIFGLFPNENIKTHSIVATLRLVALHIPLLFIIIPAILDCYVHRNALNVVRLTNIIYTTVVFIMLDSIYLYLCVRKFELRDIICELRAMVEQRKYKQLKHVTSYIFLFF